MFETFRALFEATAAFLMLWVVVGAVRLAWWRHSGLCERCGRSGPLGPLNDLGAVIQICAQCRLRFQLPRRPIGRVLPALAIAALAASISVAAVLLIESILDVQPWHLRLFVIAGISDVLGGALSLKR